MIEYGIGGNEVPVDASESIAAIPENRTLIIEQLTSDEPVSPEVVTGLTSIDSVFAHYKPQVDIEFENGEGQPINETLYFNSVGDFSVKNMTEQSSFLNQLDGEDKFWKSMQKQLRSNKILQRALQDPKSRQDIIDALRGVKAELEAAGKEE